MAWVVGSDHSPPGLLLGVPPGLETLRETESVKCGKLFSWTMGPAGKKNQKLRNSHNSPFNLQDTEKSGEGEIFTSVYVAGGSQLLGAKDHREED